MQRRIGLFWLAGIISAFLHAEETFPEVRAIWLERSVISNGAEAMRASFGQLAQAGFNTVYLNNWYKGGMIYPSQVLTDYGGESQLPEYSGWDPVEIAIQEGHRLNLNIHLWFEYGLVGYSGTTNWPGPILSTRPEWLMLDRNLNNYHYIADWSLYQFWMDPAATGVTRFICDLFAECVTRYPALDGIQIDRFRFPNITFSYSAVARERYQTETGGADPLTIGENDPEWGQFIAWRENLITTLMDSVYQTIKRINPRCLVSAAVVPPYMLTGAQAKLQNWGDWHDRGIVDLLNPMLYGLHSELAYWVGRCLDKVAEPLRLAPGIAIGGMGYAALHQAISTLRSYPLAGVTFWYSGDLSAELLAGLEAQAFHIPAPSVERAVIVDDANPWYVAQTAMTCMSGGFNGTYLSGDQPQSTVGFRLSVYLADQLRLETYLPAVSGLPDGHTYIVEYPGGKDTIYKSLQADEWNSLAVLQPVHPGWMTVRPLADPTGRVLADAFRLVRRIPLMITEGFTPDQTHIRLRFNRAPAVWNIDPTDLTIFPATAITAVEVSGDGLILTIWCDALEPATDYRLALRQPEADTGSGDSLVWTFRYIAGLTRLVDNSESYFQIQSGVWISQSDFPGVTGHDCLTTPGGDGAARVYWRYPTPQAGYYRLSAFFPDSVIFAPDAQFMIKNGTRYDTVRIDQRLHYPSGAGLGIVWADLNTNLVVKLHNNSSVGANCLVVADAVLFERAFFTTDTPTGEDRLRQPVFRLTPAYPNPCNPIATLEFELTREQDFRVTVYDLRGREVLRNHWPALASGRHRMQLDLSGQGSGVYIYQVICGTDRSTGKLVMLK